MDTEGATMAKKLLEKKLETIAYKACKNMLVYAGDTPGKEVLAAKYDIKKY